MSEPLRTDPPPQTEAEREMAVEKRQPGPVGPREAFYDQHIAPLMSQIARLCDAGEIDFLVHFALDEDATSYRAAGRCRLARHLRDMEVARHILRGDAEVRVVTIDAQEGAAAGPPAPEVLQ